MFLFRRSVLICNLLLVALLTSVFGVASANNFTYSTLSDGSKSITKIRPPALDCQHFDTPQARQKCQQAWYDIIKTADNESQATHQCQRLINAITLFPATTLAELKKIQSFSREPISEELLGKSRSFTEQIDRPPIV